jgi:toxin FitB
VLSAFAPGKRPVEPKTVAWFDERTDGLFLSAITAAEIEAGIVKLRRTGSVRRADELRDWFERMLSLYSDRVLPFDLIAARTAGALTIGPMPVGGIRALQMSPSRRSLSLGSL